MTPAARLSDLTSADRSRLVCRRLAGRVNDVTPEGTGHWGPAWELVADPSDAFLDALDTWLDDDTPRSRRELLDAADEVVRVWREAGRRFEAEGRSEPREALPT